MTDSTATTPTDVSQLATELGQRLSGIAELSRTHPALTPLAETATATAVAGELLARLNSTDPSEAGGTAHSLTRALWPPEGTPPQEWWTTPLGRLVAGALAPVTPETDVVSVTTAGKMLGTGHSRVNQLVGQGQLEHSERRTADAGPRSTGSVTLRSVLARIARAPGPGRPGWTAATRERHGWEPDAEA